LCHSWVRREYHSYAANVSATETEPNITSGFQDGLSNTIFAAERFCYLPSVSFGNPAEFHLFSIGQGSISNFLRIVVGERRASFADRGYFDVVPATSGFPPVSRPSRAGVTFQAKPLFPECDVHQLQSPYASGLQVAMFDGSVRFLRKDISETAFWGMTTRNAGDIAE